MMNSNDFKVGDRVLFGRERGEKTLGEVVKVNRVKLKIKQLDARGTMRNYPVGTIWTVPPSLAEHAGARLSFHPEREFTAPSRQPAIVIPPVPPKDVSCGRTEKEIKKEILGIYCSLSPENLSCDG
jgi:hypothetical protein